MGRPHYFNTMETEKTIEPEVGMWWSDDVDRVCHITHIHNSTLEFYTIIRSTRKRLSIGILTKRRWKAGVATGEIKILACAPFPTAEEKIAAMEEFLSEQGNEITVNGHVGAFVTYEFTAYEPFFPGKRVCVASGESLSEAAGKLVWHLSRVEEEATA